MEFLIGLAITAVLLLVGLVVGGYLEKRHFKSLDARETQNGAFTISQMKNFPGGASESHAPAVLIGEAVISSDYLKSFLAGFRKFFGGEMGSYLTLLERARREALLRVVEQAQAHGYDAICNLRYDTADMGGAVDPKRKVVYVAIIASATAYKRTA